MRTTTGVVLLLALSLAAVLAVPRNSQRIEGGTATTIADWPYMAALLFVWGGAGIAMHACGGSILTSSAILTAAHCVHGDATNNWRTRVGSTNSNFGGLVFNTRLINSHRNFNAVTYNNDISVLRTTTLISYNVNVQPAPIAGHNYYLGDNEVVWAIGWGAIADHSIWSEQLLEVQIWTVNQATCRSRYAELGMIITDNMLCSGWLDVGGRDQCQGDTGGPLVHNNTVVGVCSWRYHCSLPRYPGVSTRLSRYTNWIQSATV